MASSISGSSSQSLNEAANQSTVSGSGSITITVGDFSGMQSWGRVTIGGVNYDTPGPTSMSAGASWGWGSSRTYDHTPNGERGSVDVSVSFWIDGTAFHANSTGAGTQGALNYDRKPGTPASCSAVLNADKSVTVTAGSVSSPAGSATFYVQYASSVDGGATYGAWSTQSTMSGQTYSFAGLTPGLFYKFRVWASNSDGTGSVVESSALFVPSGFKIKTAGGLVNARTFKIKTATGWVDVRTFKIKTAGGWVNPV